MLMLKHFRGNDASGRRKRTLACLPPFDVAIDRKVVALVP